MNRRVLVINCGSSSIKFQLLDIATKTVIIRGLAEELGSATGRVTFKWDDQAIIEPLPDADFETAMQRIFDELQTRGLKDAITAVGHRVVNGGEAIKESVIIDDNIVTTIEQATNYAPLHHPAQIAGIRAVSKIMPDLPQVAVFDTAFHQTMPERAYRYAVPAEWYRKYGIRRYGAHGTSYRFVSRAAAKLLGMPPNRAALVIAHIGNGVSVAAVLNGKSVDTSMGLTPLEGPVMGTRSGDIDPSIITFMKQRLGKTAEEILDILNKESGLIGLSEISSDIRDLETAMENGNPAAQLTLKVATFRLAKYIAAMMVSLPRVDAIVFTGGGGENESLLRSMTVRHLAVLGYKLDPKQNEKIRGRDGLEGLISAVGTPKILVVKTDEELMIAEDTARLVSS